MASSPAPRTSSLLSSSRFSSSAEKRNTTRTASCTCLITIGLDYSSFTRIDLVEGIRVQTSPRQFERGGHRATGEKPGRASVVFQSRQQHWTQLPQQTQQLRSTSKRLSDQLRVLSSCFQQHLEKHHTTSDTTAQIWR